MVRGLIFNISRYSVHDGPGIRTTFFLKGCPMHCPWCHNPEGISSRPQKIFRERKSDGKIRILKETAGKWYSSEEILFIALKDRIFYDESEGGVTFSGGEPLLQPEFLLHTLSLLREAGIHTAVDTSAHAPPDLFMQAAMNTDLLLCDMKTADNNMHISYTGASNELSLANIRSLTGDNPHLIIRIPLIPGFNSDKRQMEGIRDQLLDLKAEIRRIDLLPYHRLGHEKYRHLGLEVPVIPDKPAGKEHIGMLMKIFSEAGFEVK